MTEDPEELEMEDIKLGHFRVVRSPKRKRLLHKRGESIWWSIYQHAWIWDASNRGIT